MKQSTHFLDYIGEKTNV